MTKRLVLSAVVLLALAAPSQARERKILNRLLGRCPAAQGAHREVTISLPQEPVRNIVNTTGRIVEQAGFRLRTFGGGSCANGNCGR